MSTSLLKSVDENMWNKQTKRIGDVFPPKHDIRICQAIQETPGEIAFLLDDSIPW